jgi:hypothetical protein
MIERLKAWEAFEEVVLLGENAGRVVTLMEAYEKFTWRGKCAETKGKCITPNSLGYRSAMKMMLTHRSTVDRVGGVATFIFELADAFIMMGHEVSVLMFFIEHKM